MNRYDIAIVGTGPGGLEAAITAKIRNKDIILFGNKNLSLKITKATEINNYLGFPDITGEELAKAYDNHLQKMNIDINASRINTIYAMGDYFALQSAEEMFEAKSVIISTGVVTGKTLPGENENLGRGVSYCATCDAALYKGKEAIVIGYSPKEEEEVIFLAERAEKVTYIAMYKNVLFLADNIEVVEGIFPRKIIKNEDRITLVPGLLIEDGHIVVDRAMRTNIEGVFACGDVTGKPYQYIKAAGEGNVAALSAVSYLVNKA